LKDQKALGHAIDAACLELLDSEEEGDLGAPKWIPLHGDKVRTTSSLVSCCCQPEAIPHMNRIAVIIFRLAFSVLESWGDERGEAWYSGGFPWFSTQLKKDLINAVERALGGKALVTAAMLSEVSNGSGLPACPNLILKSFTPIRDIERSKSLKAKSKIELASVTAMLYSHAIEEVRLLNRGKGSVGDGSEDPIANIITEESLLTKRIVESTFLREILIARQPRSKLNNYKQPTEKETELVVDCSEVTLRFLSSLLSEELLDRPIANMNARPEVGERLDRMSRLSRATALNLLSWVNSKEEAEEEVPSSLSVEHCH